MGSTEYSFELLRPDYLWLAGLLVGIYLIALCVAIATRRSSLSKLEGILKLLTAFLLAVALARPAVLHEVPEGGVEVLVDVSDSVDSDYGQKLLDNAARLLEQQQGTPVRLFANRTSSQRELPRDYREIRDSSSSLGRASTSLEKALEAASTSSGRVLLLSDGWETSGTTLKALSGPATGGVRVFPLIDSGLLQVKPKVTLESCRAPQLAASGQSIELSCSVLNSTSTAQPAQFSVVQKGKQIYSEQVVVQPDSRKVVLTTTDPLDEGLTSLVVKVTPQERNFSASTRTVFIGTEPKEKVLLLSGSAEDSLVFEDFLSEQSFAVVGLQADGAQMESLPDLEGVSTVILNNVPYKYLPYGGGVQLADFVKQGGSLLMLGGNASFGLGGYIDTPIEELLPVTLVPPRTEKKRLNVAVQLVMDKSGSMKQGGKITSARLAAQQVVKGLKNADYFGLVAFDSSPFVVQPMGQLAKIRKRALGAPDLLMHPNGTTNLFPALDMGLNNLARVKAGRKHLIILTDGKIPDGATRGELYKRAVQNARLLNQVTVSTFLIGPEQDFLLEDLAKAGGGTFYRTRSAQSLPQLFMKDVRVQTAERTQKETAEYDVAPQEAYSASSIQSFPPVLGYVETRAKDGAFLELAASSPVTQDPLYAWWRSGDGKVAAFTSDVNGRWSRLWVNWKRYSQFWSDVLGSLRPESGASSIPFSLSPEIRGSSLLVDIQLFAEPESAVSLWLRQPNGAEVTLLVEQKVKGRYEAVLPDAKPGDFQAAVLIGEQRLPLVGFAMDAELFGEQQGRGVAEDFLRELAAHTGGVVNPSPGELFSSSAGRIERQDISSWFMGLALILWILSVLAREWSVCKRAFMKLMPARA